ncbi:ricin-type beta-trefoil lectin domain protein [Streptomyces sp. NPDC086787]|uniref:ricin-type beta-trefoil lectin domain protein n=1 Tax=Streptomyces sp. NPDC086787 TaxID=3365759 RepID=UPI003802BFCA
MPPENKGARSAAAPSTATGAGAPEVPEETTPPESGGSPERPAGGRAGASAADTGPATSAAREGSSPETEPDTGTGADEATEATVEANAEPTAPEPAAGAATASGGGRALGAGAIAKGAVAHALAKTSGGPPSTATATAPGPGQLKKPVLAAAVVVGALLTAVPLAFLARDRDSPRAQTTASDSLDGTVLGAGAPSSPGTYATKVPPAKGSPSGAASGPGTKGAPSKAGVPAVGAAGAAGASGVTPAAPAAKPKTAPKKSSPAKTAPRSGGSAAKKPVKAYFLIDPQAGLCLTGGSPAADGKQLRLAHCNGLDEQRWEFRSDGTVRSQGLCMDVAWAATENGTRIQSARCSGNYAQQFYLSSNKEVVSRLASKCVDAQWSGTTEGTPAILWTCHGSDNQKWVQWIDR